ncbi:MAG: hypothetical protein LUQ07_08085 [Methanospirillum sp.]|nr:hypothetical protein [Methanospirillum sp.]
MQEISWQIRLGVALLSCSALVYLAKLYFIDNIPGTVEYVFNSFGFLFINVLLVTLVINGLLSRRARKERLDKLNMVIGIFYTEVGDNLLSLIIPADPGREVLSRELLLQPNVPPETGRMKKNIGEYQFQLDPSQVDLPEIHHFLNEKRNFLLRLMENPVLLEHQSFTGLLQSTFHLAAELEQRKDLREPVQSDRLHLMGDISRVYGNLTREWVAYMDYLYRNYPYLYSLAVRTNPYDPSASAEVY